MMTELEELKIKRPQYNFICPRCLGRKVVIKERIRKKRKEILEVISRRVPEKMEYDQAPITIDSLLFRIAYLANEFIDEKRMLFLGDDDFTSISLALITKPAVFTVMDIDERIIDNIKKIALEKKLPIKVIHYDVRENMPKQYIGNYDLFFVDPPSNPAGMSLFLARGFAALKREHGVKAFLALPCPTIPLQAKILPYETQKFILESGFIITEFLPKFHEYLPPAGILSGMLRMERFKIKEPLIKGSYCKFIYYDVFE